MVTIHFFPFLISYLGWHYSLGLLAFVDVWKNLLWFVGRFFSMPLLLRTLFSKWRRLGDPYESGFNLSKLGEAIIINVLMRLVGAFIRLFIVLVGLLLICAVVAFGAVAFATWLFLPALIPVLFVFGFITVITGQL